METTFSNMGVLAEMHGDRQQVAGEEATSATSEELSFPGAQIIKGENYPKTITKITHIQFVD